MNWIKKQKNKTVHIHAWLNMEEGQNNSLQLTTPPFVIFLIGAMSADSILARALAEKLTGFSEQAKSTIMERVVQNILAMSTTTSGNSAEVSDVKQSGKEWLVVTNAVMEALFKYDVNPELVQLVNSFYVDSYAHLPAPKITNVTVDGMHTVIPADALGPALPRKWHVVVAHADHHGSGHIGWGSKSLSCADAASQLMKQPEYTQGTPVLLFACKTGNFANGCASDFAKKIKQDVIAPSENINIILNMPGMFHVMDFESGRRGEFRYYDYDPRSGKVTIVEPDLNTLQVLVRKALGIPVAFEDEISPPNR